MDDSARFVVNSAFYILFTLLLCLWIISLLYRRYRFYYSSQQQPTAALHPLGLVQAGIPHSVVISTNQELPNGLDPSIIETFPKFTYSVSKQDPSLKLLVTGECGVCLGAYEEKDVLRLLPKYSHVFHADCVDPWLKSWATCPLCRANLVHDSHPLGMPPHAEVRVNIS